LLAICLAALTFAGYSGTSSDEGVAGKSSSPRTRLSINDDWRFIKGDPPNKGTGLAYEDVKSWILPTGNDFLVDPAMQSNRPDGNPGDDVPYVSPSYDDSSWRMVNLPHNYAIEGPFTTEVSGSTGCPPSAGIVWYRKDLSIPAGDTGKSIFLDIDGAMSYSMTWLNGRFVGGWPHGYASYRLNLTPYVKFGETNVLAIRLDNPVPKGANWQSPSSRWYPGAGLYRNVWIVKTEPVHIGQ
jgi:beta-galactosidase